MGHINKKPGESKTIHIGWQQMVATGLLGLLHLASIYLGHPLTTWDLIVFATVITGGTLATHLANYRRSIEEMKQGD